MIPHHDPTDIFFSSKGKEPRKAQKEIPQKNYKETKKHKGNEDTCETEGSSKRMKTEPRENINKNLSDHFSKVGLQINESLPDGNCFFHSLSTLTGETHKNLRTSIVTKMRFQQNVYNELFTEELRMKYFIDEANMEDRCRIMLQDKAWAGFPEKIAAAIFMGQNLFECYKQQNESFHWNVFLGSMDPGVLEENNLENVFIFYDASKRHFSPLLKLSNFNNHIPIANIYCLLSEGSEDNGFFLQITPSQLSPNHNMYKSAHQRPRRNQPTGLRNTGLMCYFISLMQCLYAIPVFVNGLQIDRMYNKNDNSFTAKICELLKGLSEKKPLNTLEGLTEDVMTKIWQRFENQFLPEHQQDPEEFLLHMQLLFNEDKRTPNQLTLYKNFPDLEQTKKNFETSNRSNTTQLTTLYVKVVKIFHNTCRRESFEPIPYLLTLRFSENMKQSTTVEEMLKQYLQKQNTENSKCPNCNLPNSPTTEETIIVHLPDILVVSLGR